MRNYSDKKYLISKNHIIPCINFMILLLIDKKKFWDILIPQYKFF